MRILCAGRPVGAVTSGTYSPSLDDRSAWATWRRRWPAMARRSTSKLFDDAGRTVTARPF